MMPHMTPSKTIAPGDLICMNAQDARYTYRVELAYAHDDNFLFEERIYRQDAQLWLHKDLAHIVFEAAQMCHQLYDLRFVLYDGLRTCEAQTRMMQTQRAKDNPHWMETPRLLSLPGTGGHPRAMAIDIDLETPEGTLLDMGTPFDFLADRPDAEHNPAHRDFRHPPEILDNRGILNLCMHEASLKHGVPLYPLPEEWWDFRLPPEVYNQYAPLSEADLPEKMRLLDV